MKRISSLQVLVIIGMTIILTRLFFVQVILNKHYIEKKKELTEITVLGSTAPRGRIYDRNGILLVDNKPKKVIYYSGNRSVKEELELIDKLSSLIEVNTNKVTKRILSDYYLAINKDINLITDYEKELYDNRKITKKEIEELKYSRISTEELDNLDKEKAYIYYLINNGYSYMDKVIKDQDVTDYEYAIVAENLANLSGIGIKLDWEREYLYGNIFKGIFGRVGEIPLENQSYYIDKGYTKNDIVGVSYLEYQYDDYLKGNKNKYSINNKGNYNLIKEGTKGNDIYLTIDIELQKQLENIIIESIMNAKTEPNTKYLNKSFVVVTNPSTGEIIAMAGKQIINNQVYDYTPGIITSSYVVGSTVKGASHIVGYNTGSLYIGEVRDDSCIKIRATNEKCSWKYLGRINDLLALKYSSNTYQFRTAINVGKGNYIYNGSLSLSDDAFDIYRKTFNSFGLGIKTEIDLPNEKLGYIGNKKDAGLLLDFSIGQYDTYTPIELSTYINTIANNGERIKPFLLKKVIDNNGDIIYESKRTVIGNVDTKIEYINRVKEGFKEALEIGGTGYNYIDSIYKPAGKTGTSQSFVDTNLDGKIDTKTLSTAFVGYAPYDNPRFSIAVITPDVSDYSSSDYASKITPIIVKKVSNSFFARY